jgi:DNA polymerase I-like protein with 3'-5' exonuclease and polymerase domains
VVALDIETTGLDPRADRIVLVCLSDGERTLVLDPQDPDLPRALRELFTSRELVVHRSGFDLPFLCLHLGLPVPPRVWDTRLAERALTNGLGLDLSLAASVERRLGVTLDKSLQRSFTQGGEISQEQLAYARKDAEVLLPLREVQGEMLQKRGLGKIWGLERAVLPVFLSIQVEGVPLDRDWLLELAWSNQRRADSLGRVLAERLGPLALGEKLRRFQEEQQALQEWQEALEALEEEVYQEWSQRYPSLGPEFQDLRNPDARGRPIGFRRFFKPREKAWREAHPRPPKPKEPEPFDPDSPQQVLWAFRELGYRLDSVAEEVLLLTSFSPEHRALYVDPLLAYRKAAKLYQAFGERWGDLVWPDGMVRPDIDPFGASSGRPTCSRPNLFQLPARSGPEFRKLVRAPEGFVVVAADYSQMELRIMAELSGDPVMVEAFQRGEDLHLVAARWIFGEGAGEQERKIAKNCSFLTLYGGGARRLAETASVGGVALSEREAKEILGKWRSTFAQAWATIEGWREEARVRYEIRTPWGRTRWFPPEIHPEQVAREGANCVIQGANADITKLAMVLADRGLRALGGRLILQVYDELVALVPEERAAEGAEVLKRAMLEAAGVLFRQVPVEVDAAFGPDWSCKG